MWRLESARIIAGLTGLLRDVGLAEEQAQDALVAALEQWPADGIPANPGGWLMLTARHRAIDRIRRNERLAGKLNLLGRELETTQPGAPAEFDDVLDEGTIDDDLLRLMFISCHPVLSTEARIALTLRLLGGLTTEEIARAFLAAEPTIAKRIVRAKQTLASRQVPFEVPSVAERPGRLASVLEVLYLVFNEGYSAMAGDDWMRPSLCGEALRLGRVLAGLMPDEPEVHGLVALMEIQASRLAARLDSDGLPVPLPEQNRGRWDQLLIRRGFTALLRAQELGGAPGPYVLQAAIAAGHARAGDPAETDWEQIALLYRALGAVAPSPVVELNRAVAVARAFGPERGLEVVDGLAAEPALAGYHHLPSVRGDLLARLGRDGEAAGEFRRAAALTRNIPERTVLLRRAAECDARGLRVQGRRRCSGLVRDRPSRERYRRNGLERPWGGGGGIGSREVLCAQPCRENAERAMIRWCGTDQHNGNGHLESHLWRCFRAGVEHDRGANAFRRGHGGNLCAGENAIVAGIGPEGQMLDGSGRVGDQHNSKLEFRIRQLVLNRRTLARPGQAPDSKQTQVLRQLDRLESEAGMDAVVEGHGQSIVCGLLEVSPGLFGNNFP